MNDLASNDIDDDLPPVTRKQKIIFFGSIAATLLIIFLTVNAAMSRPKGTELFGVCKTFIELQIKYPKTLDVTEVEQFARAVRIYYSYIDPYGNHKSDFIECAFEKVPGKGVQIQTILLNRIEIDKQTIADFNETITAVRSGDPNLTVPRPFGNDLKDLKN